MFISPINHALPVATFMRCIEIRVGSPFATAYEFVADHTGIGVAHYRLPECFQTVIQVRFQDRLRIMEFVAVVFVMRIVEPDGFAEEIL